MPLLKSIINLNAWEWTAIVLKLHVLAASWVLNSAVSCLYAREIFIDQN